MPLLTGVSEIAAALRLRRYIEGESLLALSGIASLLLGMLTVALPWIDFPVVTLWIGIYALVFGVLLIVLGFKLRAWLNGPKARAFQRTAHARPR